MWIFLTNTDVEHLDFISAYVYDLALNIARRLADTA